MEERPLVSVVMPILNEERFIERSLGAVLRQDYPADRIEILVADGGSTDRTLPLLDDHRARHPDREIAVLANPGRTPGSGLNEAIRRAHGSVIVRVDGHSEVATDYVRECLRALRASAVTHIRRGGWREARDPA